MWKSTDLAAEFLDDPGHLAADRADLAIGFGGGLGIRGELDDALPGLQGQFRIFQLVVR